MKREPPVRWKELALLIITVLIAFGAGFSYGRAYQAELMIDVCKPAVLRRWFDSWKLPGEEMNSTGGDK